MKQSIEDAYRKVQWADQNGWLEEEVQIICDTYGLDETTDRKKILMLIAEQKIDEQTWWRSVLDYAGDAAGVCMLCNIYVG